MNDTKQTLWEEHAAKTAAKLYTDQGYEVLLTSAGSAPDHLVDNLLANLEPRLGTTALRPELLKLLVLVDLIAFRSDRVVFVEVRGSGSNLSRRDRDLDALARLVDELPDARLDVVSLPNPLEGLPARENLLRVLQVAEMLADPYTEGPPSVPDVQPDQQAAIVMGALALEGALSVIAARTGVPTKPDAGFNSLISALSAQGFLSPADGASAASIWSKRNQIAHGTWINRYFGPGEVALALEDVRRLIEHAFMEADDIVASVREQFSVASQDQTAAAPSAAPVIEDVPSSNKGDAEGTEGARVVDTRTLVELQFASVPTAVREEAIVALDAVSTYWLANDVS